MLKSAKVEIKKEHQVLMVNKTTSFKKKGKGQKGNFKKNSKQVAAPIKKPNAGPKLETECLTLLVLIVSPGYLIPVQLLRLVTRNRSCKMNRN